MKTALSAAAGPVLPQGITVLERGWLSSNNVVVCGEYEAAIVDSGYCTHAAQTVSLVEAIVRDRSVTVLANTHLHSDHCGGNAALRRRFPGLSIVIPPGLAHAVRAWDAEALTYAPTGQSCPRFSADRLLEPGSSVRLGDIDWDVYAAPGHDPNSVILFEPICRVLISADALWANGFGVVFPELEGEHAFDEVAATLDLIEALQPLFVIPGHGCVFTDVDAALTRARSRLAAYIASPVKHANHAAKVLLKFKLLDLQEVNEVELKQWAARTSYFRLVHSRWGGQIPWAAWLSQLIADLIKSRALERRGALLVNS